jgi:hypothetical protein
MSEQAKVWAGPVKPACGLAELLDRDAVGQLVRTYALGFDLRDYALTRSVFAPDATMDGPKGPDPVEDALPKVFAMAADWAGTQHLLGQQYVQVEGDEAVVWTYAVASHNPKPGDPRDRVTARVQYRDRCRRYPEGWLIVQRAIELLWMEQTPQARAG